jgi:hypothetical protein
MSNIGSLRTSDHKENRSYIHIHPASTARKCNQRGGFENRRREWLKANEALVALMINSEAQG